ncbi:DUF4402 domain-containing protein [Flavobacterium frigoris]|nr:DUF4402 domain-containing protein [Flavobacterium frigoris]
MKKNLLTLATILTIGFFTNSTVAQSTTKSELTNATASAHLVQPMILEETNGLDFGTILLTDKLAGKFLLTPDASDDGVLTVTEGGNSAASVGGHKAKVGLYTVKGSKHSGYAVTLPSTITVNSTGSANIDEMTIDNLKLYFSSTSKIDTAGKLDKKGDDTFKLGGTLNIGADQGDGLYAGTFTISVDYN